MCLAGLLALATVQAKDRSTGCTLRQLSAEQEFVLMEGELTQVFSPCQSGILEFVNVDAESDNGTTFGIRLRILEVVDGVERLIHQQQGMAPAENLQRKTVFSLTADVEVDADKIYHLRIEVPGNQETRFRYSSTDTYASGHLTVNHVRLGGDLAFEVGVNPERFYHMLEEEEEVPAARQWTVDVHPDDYNLAIAQTKFDGSELMFGSSYSQTFITKEAASLSEIWFYGEFIHVENQIPVHLFDIDQDAYVGYGSLEVHGDEEKTLVARFSDAELKASTRYEFFIDCGERQQINLKVITQPQYFVGDFKKSEDKREANLSFIAFFD